MPQSSDPPITPPRRTASSGFYVAPNPVALAEAVTHQHYKIRDLRTWSGGHEVQHKEEKRWLLKELEKIEEDARAKDVQIGNNTYKIGLLELRVTLFGLLGAAVGGGLVQIVVWALTKH